MWYSRVLELVADALRACDPGQLACEGEQASRRVIRGMFGSGGESEAGALPGRAVNGIFRSSTADTTVEGIWHGSRTDHANSEMKRARVERKCAKMKTTFAKAKTRFARAKTRFAKVQNEVRKGQNEVREGQNEAREYQYERRMS